MALHIERSQDNHRTQLCLRSNQRSRSRRIWSEILGRGTQPSTSKKTPSCSPIPLHEPLAVRNQQPEKSRRNPRRQNQQTLANAPFRTHDAPTSQPPQAAHVPPRTSSELHDRRPQAITSLSDPRNLVQRLLRRRPQLHHAKPHQRPRLHVFPLRRPRSLPRHPLAILAPPAPMVRRDRLHHLHHRPSPRHVRPMRRQHTRTQNRPASHRRRTREVDDRAHDALLGVRVSALLGSSGDG